MCAKRTAGAAGHSGDQPSVSRRRGPSESDYPEDAFAAMNLVSPEDRLTNVRLRIQVQETTIESAEYELLRTRDQRKKRDLLLKLDRLRTHRDKLIFKRSQLRVEIREDRRRKQRKSDILF
jgi:hypothetical protein